MSSYREAIFEVVGASGYRRRPH